MGEPHTFEDVIRAVARRKALVVLAIAVLAFLGAAYGRLTSSSSIYSAEASISVGESNAVTLGNLDPVRFERPTALAEADRLAARLVELVGDDHTDVSVRATISNASVIVKANGTSATEAEELAMDTASAYIDTRRQVGRGLYTTAARSLSDQTIVIDDQLDLLDQQIAAASDSTALQLRRAALAEDRFKIQQAIDTAELNAETFNAGLNDPVLVEPALAAGAGGWIVFGIVGAILGAMVGIGLAMLAASIDHRVRSRADAERVAGGLPIIGVVPRGARDEVELDAVEARVRGLGSGQAIVFVSGGPVNSTPADIVEALRRAGGDVAVAERLTGNEQRPVVIGVRSGSTRDVDLASSVSDLSARGTTVLGVLIWDVPAGDLEWARRPFLVRS